VPCGGVGDKKKKRRKKLYRGEGEVVQPPREVVNWMLMVEMVVDKTVVRE